MYGKSDVLTFVPFAIPQENTYELQTEKSFYCSIGAAS